MEFKEIKNDVTVTIDSEGIYSIIKLKNGSKSIAIVEDIERGPGWNLKLNKLKGIKYYQEDGITSKGWNSGENLSFGKRYEVHISKLNVLEISTLPKPKRDDNGHAIAINYILQYESL